MDHSNAKVRERIYRLRGRCVLLDFDLAELYGVPTKRLIEQVRRNQKRFPPDFLFQLTAEELRIWRSHIATSNPGSKMGLRRPPYAFTEHGVAMLSSVLHSDRAIQANITIMRAFVRFQRIMSSNKSLVRRLDALEQRYDTRFEEVFAAIRALLEGPDEPPREIGFRP